MSGASAQTDRVTSVTLATAAIVCVAYAALALLLLHLLRPDLAPRSHMISDYGVGQYGWVMSTVFLSLSGGNVALFIGLLRLGPNSRVARVGIALLPLIALGLAVSAIFPTDLLGGPSTRSGFIHSMSFLVNISCVILASILLSASMGGDARWRSRRPTAIALTALILVACVIQFLTLHRGMPYGLANRFAFFVMLVWSLALSTWLRVVAKTSSSSSVAA
jgi:hypothetical protein